MVFAPNGILFEDDVIMAFRDIHPRAAVHILVVPKQHIRNSSELSEKHINLSTLSILDPPMIHESPPVQYMVSVGKTLLEHECEFLFSATGSIAVNDKQFGFHQYPFNSVNHLHLHCLVPPFTSCWSKLRFSESIIGHYISADNLIQHLRDDGGG
ncbi:Aste57867_22482 [Aphanomyces stellatus]|uniref:Aste57867_22482 protein n=1 Tax=Aphanomyces stellatus TaxID=120398 RepID=A0A485LLV8_9STRA|nr:hypothetical protein As57867_022412 [Aphanomyces stellatus]VFT99142.1 Aste57867_22482 [Aphanomyces stellatus]